MDKSLILAVAGSGKTTFIVDKLNLEKRALIITYTINNTRNLKESIIKKFGYFPDNIELYSYFNFLYSFCFRPFLAYKLKPKGIYWDIPPHYTRRLSRDDINFYKTKDNKFYHNRLAKLLTQKNILPDINKRLEKYFDCLFIDEVQDFAGHDFNLLKSIIKSKIQIKLVGDFYQHTFDTSRDGNVNANLHIVFDRYQRAFAKLGVRIDNNHLNKSYRCRPSICNFISENIGISLDSHSEEDCKVVYVETKALADELFKNDKIVKLFFQEHYKYSCFSRNWGDCKGENCYDDVCVVLNNKSHLSYKKGTLSALPPTSKNKLYVACTRARADLYLVPEELIKEYKAKGITRGNKA